MMREYLTTKWYKKVSWYIASQATKKYYIFIYCKHIFFHKLIFLNTADKEWFTSGAGTAYPSGAPEFTLDF